jgi:hypothetical protein
MLLSLHDEDIYLEAGDYILQCKEIVESPWQRTALEDCSQVDQDIAGGLQDALV